MNDLSQNEVMRYSFYVDSAKRSSGTNTDLYVSLSQVINPLSANGRFMVYINSCSIPFSFYQLSTTEDLNVLPVYVRNVLDVAGRTTSISLQPGNYTPYTLLTELNSRLTAVCEDVGIVGFTPFTPVFAHTYNPTTGHITFSLVSPVNCEINLLFSTSSITQTLSGFFGLGGVDVVMTTSTTQTSTRPCVLNPVNYLYIRSSLKQFRNREWTVQPDDVSDILQRIPIGTTQGTWIQHDTPSDPVYIVDSFINSINFYLTTNLTYEAVDLQNINWSFQFTIIEVKKPDYEPISALLSSNRIAKVGVEDAPDMEQKLEAIRQTELAKVEGLKKTLEVPPVVKEKEKVPEEKSDAFRSPDDLIKPNKMEYTTMSKVAEFQRILYPSIFGDRTGRPLGEVLSVIDTPEPATINTPSE
jgi:hypothetical protein